MKQFYIQKLASNGLNLEDFPFNVVPVNVPSGVLDAYNYLGGEDSDPQPEFHTLVKRGFYTVHESLVVKVIGKLGDADAAELEQSLRGWLGL